MVVRQHERAPKSTKPQKMKSTTQLIDNATESMSKAAEDDISMEQTVYYSNQAILLMLSAVVFEIRNLRETIESKP